MASPSPSDAEPSVRIDAAPDDDDRPTRRPLPVRWAVAAFGLDVAIVIAFAAVGRRSHEESRDMAGVLGTAAPFLLGLVVGWVVVGLIARRTHDRYGTWLDVDGGFDIWLATVIVGLAARRVLWDRGHRPRLRHRRRRRARCRADGLALVGATRSQRTSALISHPATLSTPPQQGGHDDGGTVINLYVGNLPYSTTSDELATLFGRVGAVTSAQVIMDRETNRSRGFGFVEMADEDARKAIDELTGADMGGRAITVNEARPRAPRPPRDNNRRY